MEIKIRRSINTVILSLSIILLQTLFIVSCKKEDNRERAIVSTAPITYITASSAVAGGEIIFDGGSTVTARGVCWSTTINPTITDSITLDGQGAGSYTSILTGLSSGKNGTRYFVRAYATTLSGTSYGSTMSFVTNPTVTDVDGNIYNTVTIGTQVWMVENLKVTKYQNGDLIPKVTDNSWWNLSIGAQCDYNNDATMGNKYGKLYNWYAVNDPRKIAPTGWHIPTEAEWTTLENYVTASSGVSGSVAKALASKTEWALDSQEGVPGKDLSRNNTTGFTAVPGGYRHSGTFMNLGNGAVWWSSTEYDTFSAWRRYIGYCYTNLGSYNFTKVDGFSVRCLKD